MRTPKTRHPHSPCCSVLLQSLCTSLQQSRWFSTLVQTETRARQGRHKGTLWRYMHLTLWCDLIQVNIPRQAIDSKSVKHQNYISNQSKETIEWVPPTLRVVRANKSREWWQLWSTPQWWFGRSALKGLWTHHLWRVSDPRSRRAFWCRSLCDGASARCACWLTLLHANQSCRRDCTCKSLWTRSGLPAWCTLRLSAQTLHEHVLCRDRNSSVLWGSGGDPVYLLGAWCWWHM